MPLIIPTRFYQPRGAFDPAGGGCLDADYSTWKATVGSVGATQETAINQLIVSLKSASVWTKMDRIWLLNREHHAGRYLPQELADDFANRNPDLYRECRLCKRKFGWS